MITEKEVLAIELVYAYQYFKKTASNNLNYTNDKNFRSLIDEMFSYKDEFLQSVFSGWGANGLEAYYNYQHYIDEYMLGCSAESCASTGLFKSKIDKMRSEERRAGLTELRKYLDTYNDLYEQTSFYHAIYIAPSAPNNYDVYKDYQFKTSLFDQCIYGVVKKHNLSDAQRNQFKNYANSLTIENRGNIYFSNNKLAGLQQTICNSMQSLTDNLEIIPEYYATQEAINYMLFYFVNKRGDNIKELINLYEQEKWQRAVLQSLDNISASIEKLSRKLDEKMIKIAKAFSCLEISINNKLMFLDNKIDAIADETTQHYLKLAKKIADLNSNDIDYQNRMLDIFKNIQNTIDGVVYNIGNKYL